MVPAAFQSNVFQGVFFFFFPTGGIWHREDWMEEHFMEVLLPQLHEQVPGESLLSHWRAMSSNLHKGWLALCFLHLPTCLDIWKDSSLGESYSKLLTSGKASLHGFEHARKIIWPICHSAWQAWTHCLPINVLELMLQFQDLSCSRGIGSFVWTRMDWGLACASLFNRDPGILGSTSVLPWRLVLGWYNQCLCPATLSSVFGMQCLCPHSFVINNILLFIFKVIYTH